MVSWKPERRFITFDTFFINHYSTVIIWCKDFKNIQEIRYSIPTTASWGQTKTEQKVLLDGTGWLSNFSSSSKSHCDIFIFFVFLRSYNFLMSYIRILNYLKISILPSKILQEMTEVHGTCISSETFLIFFKRWIESTYKKRPPAKTANNIDGHNPSPNTNMDK